VLKTLAVRTGIGYVLAVIPASCRLDLHLIRDALGHHQARLARKGNWPATSPTTSWAPCPRWGVARLGGVRRSGGAQPRIRTQELFASEQVTTVPLVRQADWGTDDLLRRRRAAQQELAGGWYPGL
jgi:hypothetical protein